MFEASSGKGEHCTLLVSSLYMLDQLGMSNPGVSRPTTIIHKLMAAKGINPAASPGPNEESSPSRDLDQHLPTQSEPLPLMTMDYLPEFNSVGPDTIANWLGDNDDPFRDDQLYGFMDASYLYQVLCIPRLAVVSCCIVDGA